MGIQSFLIFGDNYQIILKDMGYFLKKLMGYGILGPPPPFQGLIYDHPDVTSAVYSGLQARNQIEIVLATTCNHTTIENEKMEKKYSNTALVTIKKWGHIHVQRTPLTTILIANCRQTYGDDFITENHCLQRCFITFTTVLGPIC